MTRKSQPVTEPMTIAIIIALGALIDGRGISSDKCDTASKAVKPRTDWRRASMNAIPSGQPVVLVHDANTFLAGWYSPLAHAKSVIMTVTMPAMDHAMAPVSRMGRRRTANVLRR